MINALVVSTLFPNSEQPNHGVFVENRLRHTLALGDIDAKVVAPVPYFPSRSNVWGRYAAYARVPKFEQRFGTEISHPRYLVIPKVGTVLGPRLLFNSVRRAARRIREEGFAADEIGRASCRERV